MRYSRFNPRRRNIQIYLCVFILAVVCIGLSLQVIQHGTVPYIGTPDIQYVKGKVLQILDGNLFTDPITGIMNFHPPIYHAFLAFCVTAGIDIDSLLILLSVLNLWLLIFMSFLVVLRVFDIIVGFLTALIIPFLFTYLGPNYFFLATAFYFSVPLFLGGLYFYLSDEGRSRNCVIAAILWGMAFLISPVYVFIIGLLLLYTMVCQKKNSRYGYNGRRRSCDEYPFHRSSLLYLFAQS